MTALQKLVALQAKEKASGDMYRALVKVREYIKITALCGDPNCCDCCDVVENIDEALAKAEGR